MAFFTIGATLPVLMAMAVLPVIYFPSAALWLRNRPALVFAADFEVAHSVITCPDHHSY